MMLKDVSVFIKDLTAMKSAYDAISLDGMIKALEDAPTIDAVEVNHLAKEAYELGYCCDKNVLRRALEDAHSFYQDGYKAGYAEGYHKVCSEIPAADVVDKQEVENIKNMVIHGIYKVCIMNGYDYEMFAKFKNEQNRLFDNYLSNRGMITKGENHEND